MTWRAIAGGFFAAGYNMLVGKLPLHSLRRAYLRSYLGEFGPGSSIQIGCRFLNGRKVFFGQRNVINFDCLFDGRKYSIRTGADVSIGPEATILTLAHDLAFGNAELFSTGFNNCVSHGLFYLQKFSNSLIVVKFQIIIKTS